MSANGKKVEWSLTEDLPEMFTKWLKERINHKQIVEGKSVYRIANEIGVSASLLSRWIGGKGPLSQIDIHKLVEYFGMGVYTTLGLERPDR